MQTWGYRLREARAVEAPARARHGFLLGAGEFCFLALDRPVELAAGGSSLGAQVRALIGDGASDSLPSAKVVAVEQLLGLELSLGRSSTGRFEASTLPARVGAELLPNGERLEGLAQKAASGEAVLLGGSAFVLTPS